MNITAESYGHTVLLHLKGELTEDTVVAFRQAVDHNLQPKEVIDLVLDLEQVTFVDSASLEFLLDLQDRLAERMGQVKFVKPNDEVRTILSITRLEPSFETYRDINEAVKALQAIG